MPDSKTTQLGQLAETPAADDLLMMVDVSDAAMAASGTNKKVPASYVARSDGSNKLITGNGKLLSVPATGTAALLEAANAFATLMTVPRLRSGGPTNLVDDQALSFTPDSANGILIILGNNLATASGIVMFRCGGGSQCAVLAAAAGTLLNCVVDTALAGTTGTDGKINISANGNDGKIYIENRRGGFTGFSWLEIG